MTLIFTFSDTLMLHPDFYATLVCAHMPSEGRKVGSFRHQVRGTVGLPQGRAMSNRQWAHEVLTGSESPNQKRPCHIHPGMRQKNEAHLSCPELVMACSSTACASLSWRQNVLTAQLREPLSHW